MINVNPEVISRIIAEIYQAAYDQSAWEGTIAHLCDLFHGSKACLARIGPDLQPGDAITTNFDPKYHQLYIDEIVNYPNPLVDVVSSAPVGSVYHDHKLIGEQLKRSVFWNEWMTPQNMYGGLASKLMASGPSFWIFDVQRGRNQNAFGASDAALMKYLSPHLVRATKINRQIKLVQPLAAAFSYLPFGVIVVDGYGQIITLNTAADALLSGPNGVLRRKSGALVTASAAGTSLLHKLIAQACSLQDGAAPGMGGDLLMRNANGADVSLSVGPLPQTHIEDRLFLQPCAVIFVREINLDVQAGFELQIRNLFGLTAREAALSASLASGRSVKETAEEIGVAYSTMRTYLENVFRKTQTRQQSQLVALLRSLQPPMQR